MAGDGIAASERQALCDLLDALGPDGPTLCEGWKTSDIAAHLFVRERRPQATPGILLGGVLGSITTRSMSAALRRYGYEGVVGKVRSGPPILLRPVDELINQLEYFVHTEDVRRASPDWAPVDNPALDDALWASLRRAARLFTRRLKGAGLELVRPDGDSIVARSGAPRAVLTGGPQELALFVLGRRSVARVELSGSADAQDAVRRSDFSA
jgi:uncharacterized protein (TIGR03085 family)